jgi:hypothetical protein
MLDNKPRKRLAPEPRHPLLGEAPTLRLMRMSGMGGSISYGGEQALQRGACGLCTLSATQPPEGGCCCCGRCWHSCPWLAPMHQLPLRWHINTEL